jgi:hypothetical protein
VLTVSVAVPVVVPLDKLIGPPTVQVGGSVALDGVTLHVSATEPVNPPVPVAVIVEVPERPGVAIVTAVPANENVAPPATATVTAADAGEAR